MAAWMYIVHVHGAKELDGHDIMQLNLGAVLKTLHINRSRAEIYTFLKQVWNRFMLRNMTAHWIPQ